MTLDSKERVRILQSIKKLVLAQHINVGGIDYAAWTELVNKRTAELLTAEVAGFEAGIRQLLAELKTSHTVFYHSLPKELLPQHTINASLLDLPLNGARKWMFLDVFEDGPAHVAGIRPGDILDAVDGTTCLPPSTPCFAIGHTHTLSVRDRGNGSQKEIVIEVPRRKGTKHRPPIVEPKSPIHAKIGSNIGLLKIPYFPGAAGMGFANALDNAVRDLKEQGCVRMIVDLRGNIGGSLGFARLASYMCPGQVAIGHSLTPRRLRKGYDPEGGLAISETPTSCSLRAGWRLNWAARGSASLTSTAMNCAKCQRGLPPAFPCPRFQDQGRSAYQERRGIEVG